MNIDSAFDEQIISLIREGVPAQFKRTKITGDTRLQIELGLDSLAIVSLVFQLECVLGADLNGNDDFAAGMSGLRTVGDLIDLCRRVSVSAKQHGS